MAAAYEWAQTKLQSIKAPLRPWLIAGAGLAVLLAVWLIFFRGDGDAEPYRTAAADRGRITRVVSATGSLQPLVSVNVGSTVSGLVEEVLVDFNSTVRAGQILARLEPDTFQQRMSQLQASVNQASADYQVAASDYARYARLAEEGFASEQMMAQQRAARARAAASVQQANAQLQTARVDYERSIIRSPIDGVVVDRQINPGQSVAASFQAPTLFVIAQDLARLQANITVDEADIGQVREAMPVRFNVDAFPDEDFEGRVSQVRQQGVDTNGVVSYTVVVEADNPGRRLLPGMTANAEIIVEETAEVARIPNAALRFQPADENLRERARELSSQGRGRQNGERQRGGEGQAIASENGQSGQGQRGEGRRGGAQAVERLAEQLGLTEAQKTQASAALQEARQAAGQPPGAGASASERRAFARRMREAALRAIEPSLTAEQRQRLAQMRQGGADANTPRTTPTRAAIIWVLRDNRPTPILVQLGAADDSYTELRGGDLQPGDQIITGGGPRNENADRQRQQQPGGFGPGGGGNMRIRGA
ncbi:MAG: efflux RND transporter periplasmic adaptor subunit [Hyphomonadaceae bacterium]